jgi:ADP-ribosyl-[dinitrogen reductase] hydrolase
LDAIPPPEPHSGVDFDRLEGMLLGLAIGDALGNTSESMNPGERNAAYGEIRNYLPNRYAGRSSVGLPSDDTQLAFWTLEHLLEHGRVVPERLGEIFSSRQIFGIGRTVSAFVEASRDGRQWYLASQRSAGNGALMRIAPVVVPHVANASPALWEDAVLAGALTHNHASSIAACVALVGILWDLLTIRKPPTPEWWLDNYCARARDIEGNAQLKPRTSSLVFAGPIWRLVDTQVREAVRQDLTVRIACDRWYSGAYLLETVPSALIILARHGHDPEEAIVRAVNDTRDNDTVAAIVGAAVGALHGRGRLPQRWISGLAGRTAANDDGRIFELVAAAQEQWGPWLPASH